MAKLDKVMDDVLEEIDTFTQQVSLELFDDTVQRTPVDNGYAKGNWNLSIGSTDFTEQRPDPDGQSVRARGERVARNIEGGDVVFISNGVDYVFWLEQGTSDQSPRGMAGPASAKAQLIADSVARRLR